MSTVLYNPYTSFFDSSDPFDLVPHKAFDLVFDFPSFDDWNVDMGGTDKLVTKEDDSGYAVYYNDPDIQNKNVDVDFNKANNEVTVTVTETSPNYSSKLTSSVTLQLPVDSNNIKANLVDNVLMVTLPKKDAALALEPKKEIPSVESCQKASNPHRYSVEVEQVEDEDVSS